jgi:hypothetical protein
MKIMKKLIIVGFSLILSLQIFAQEDKIKELVTDGINYHDQGKYALAVLKYREALQIDKSSSLANYELAYTSLTIQKYDDAIFFSRKVIDQNKDLLEHAYLVLGSALDLKKLPWEAIEVYKEGLIKFPESNLLNYNLALTAFNQDKLELAEKSSIQAIYAKSTHGSSHLVLASVMQDKEERVKAILPMYYFLMLEPDSKRSLEIYKILRTLLVKGVEQKSEKEININLDYSSGHDSLFRSAETFLGLFAASRSMESNKDKSDYEFFAETNKSLFGILERSKKENKGIWWDVYVSTLSDIIHSNNWEAFSYYISQSVNSEDVNDWIIKNPDKMAKFQTWMKSNVLSERK